MHKKSYLVAASSVLLVAFTGTVPSYVGKNLKTLNKEGLTKVSDVKVLEASHLSELGTKVLGQRKEFKDHVVNAFENCGKLSVSVEDEVANVNGKDVSVKLTPSLKCERSVRPVALGEHAYDHTIGSYQTRMEVSDALTIETDLNLSARLNDKTKLNVFQNEVGIKIQKISYPDSLDEYLDRSPLESLSSFIESVDEIEAGTKADSATIGATLAQDAEKVYNTEANSELGKRLSKMTADERMIIFFEGYFDPFKVGKKYIKISAENLDKSLKPNETLIKTYYRRSGPGVSVREGIWKARVAKVKYEIFRIGFHKEADGKLYVKTQFEERPSLELNFHAKFTGIPWSPIRFNKKISTLEEKQTLYTFNLNSIVETDTMFDTKSSYAMRQLDDLVNRVGNPINPSTEAQRARNTVVTKPGEVEKLFERRVNNLDKIIEDSFDLRLGVVAIRDESIKECELSQTGKDEDTLDNKSVLCVVEKRYNTKLLSNEESKGRKFRMFVRKNAASLLETDIGFEYDYTDTRTSRSEYAAYIQSIRNAFFFNENTTGQSAERFKKILDEKLASKSEKRNEQAVAAGIYFSQSFVKKITGHKTENMKTLLAQAIVRPKTVGQLPRWEDLVRIGAGNSLSNDCTDYLTQKYVDLFIENEASSLKSCSRAKFTANYIVSVFEEAKSKGEQYNKVARIFGTFVNNHDAKVLLPHLMLQLGLLKKIDANGVAQYNSLEDALQNREVELKLTLFGDNGSGLVVEQIGEVATLQETREAHDFDLDRLGQASATWYSADLYRDQGQNLFLEFSSIFKADNDLNVRAVLYKGADPVALFSVPNIHPISQVRRSKHVELFQYSTALADTNITQLESGAEYTLRLYLVSTEGSRISEMLPIKFKFD